jgi:3-hydroxyisobutyrate dehydrogenase
MKIGFIGLGIMGESMVLNIINKQDDPVYVYDIDHKKIDAIVNKGGHSTFSVKEIVSLCDIIITMIPNGKILSNIHKEAYPYVKENQLFIDMSTINPDTSVSLSDKLKSHKAHMIDAPVVKSKSAAINGTLGIYVGGDKALFNRAYPILKTMGENIIHLGDNGAGLTMKLAHNMLVGLIQNGVNEMLVLAEKANIKIDDFVKAIGYGGGQNFYLDGKGKSISHRDFSTAFSVKNMHKDMHLTKNLINQLSLNLPTSNHIVDLYDEAILKKLGELDFSASFKVVEKNSKKM